MRVFMAVYTCVIKRVCVEAVRREGQRLIEREGERKRKCEKRKSRE